jgi:hypothetical protein
VLIPRLRGNIDFNGREINNLVSAAPVKAGTTKMRRTRRYEYCNGMLPLFLGYY